MTYKDFFRERQEAFKDFERFAACGSLSAGQPAGSDMRRQPHHNRSKKPHRPVAPRAVYDIDNRFIALFEAGSGTAGEGISGAAPLTPSAVGYTMRRPMRLYLADGLLSLSLPSWMNNVGIPLADSSTPPSTTRKVQFS